MKDSETHSIESELIQDSLFGDSERKTYQKSKTPETAFKRERKPVRLDIIYGTCCKCNEQPAVLKSPSGNFIYCEKCGTSRCGIHTIADFELEQSTGLWLDPCVVNRYVRVEQSALLPA